MRPKPWLLLALVLLVPVAPFLALGNALDERVARWLESPPAAGATAAAVAVLLAADLVLPVPSSLVGTAAGAHLGVPLATAAVWLGLTAGGLLGFAVARKCGPVVQRKLLDPREQRHLAGLAERWGPGLVVVLRPLPVVAEASLLWLGMTGMGWRQLWPALVWSNLGLALAYAVLGRTAWAQGHLPWALAASVALPLVAATIARWCWRRRPPPPA
jgi:uncharacterized membrane protein YdjX (TVP38/TMEM64 family)